MSTARITYIIDENGVISEVIEKVDTKNHASQILGDTSAPTKVVRKTSSKPIKKVAKKAPKKSGKVTAKKKK